MRNNIIAKIGHRQFLLKDLGEADALLNIMREAIPVGDEIHPDTGKYQLFYDDDPPEISISFNQDQIMDRRSLNARTQNQTPEKLKIAANKS